MEIQDLIAASREGDANVVGTLLAKGADVNGTTDGGWSALMVASQEGHMQIAELLVNKGADIDVTNEFGTSALMLASQCRVSAKFPS